MDLRFYLFFFALYILYDNRDYLEILKGRQEQLITEHGQNIVESAENLSFSSKYFQKKTIWHLSILIMILESLVYIAYFTMAAYVFKNTIFFAFTAICAAWWLWELPGFASRFLAVIRDPKNVQVLEIRKGVRLWLRDAVFSTHAIILMVMIIVNCLMGIKF